MSNSSPQPASSPSISRNYQSMPHSKANAGANLEAEADRDTKRIRKGSIRSRSDEG